MMAWAIDAMIVRRSARNWRYERTIIIIIIIVSAASLMMSAATVCAPGSAVGSVMTGIVTAVTGSMAARSNDRREH